MRVLRRGLTGLLLLSVTLGLLAIAANTVVSAVGARMAKAPLATERAERVFAVRTTLAKETAITPELTVFGQITSRRTLEVRAQATGIITELASEFMEGGQVLAGQFLARIDPADALTALARAKTALGDAEAEAREAARALELARDELQARRDQADLQDRALARQQELNTRGVGTLTAVESAEFSLMQARQAVLAGRQTLAQAEARVDQAASATARAELALSEAERRLAETRITAGFSGTLSDVSIVQGRLVSTNEQLARLVDGKSLEVAFHVSTAQYARLLDGAGKLLEIPVRVTLDTMDSEISGAGHLSRESAEVGDGLSGRILFATLERSEGMKPGDFVTVRLDEPILARAIRLPASALGPDNTVLAIREDDRLEAVPVTLLRRQDNDILVEGPDLAGREVVSQRTPLLGEGIKVRRLLEEVGTAQETLAPEQTDLVEIDPERRARLVAYVRADTRLSEEARTRLLGALDQPRIPAQVLERLERRMGG